MRFALSVPESSGGFGQAGIADTLLQQLSHALTAPAVTVMDPAHPRAGVDGIAMTIAALANVKLAGQRQSHAGRELVQRAVAEV